MANELRIRLGVQNLTAAQVDPLRDAYRQMMALASTDNRSYAFIAGLHGVPGNYCWHHQQNDRSALNLQIFLPWHRAYLYVLEMAMRDRVRGVTLPWWDWTLRPPRQSGIPKIFSDKTANGRPNPLAGFRIDLPSARIRHNTVRHPGQPNALPTQTRVSNLMSRTDWNDFSSHLEDIHDSVHGWVSGDMGQVSTAAYDPIFWSHHCMIDRIWWLWQARNGNGNVPPDLLDVVLRPFNFRVRDVLNVNDLGYDYAAAQTISLGGT
jgi:tyrosinase